jgi:hypothetical protein
LIKNVTWQLLIYMATIAKLVEDGVLVRIEVALDGGALPWRGVSCHRVPEFLPDWLRDTLPRMASQVGAEDTPEEQVYALLELFITGARLNLGEMYKPLHPHERSIWELRTADTRIFGWFYRRDRFIAVFADDATHIHSYRLHAGYRNEVARLRDALDLDEPKLVEGVEEDDVLSVRPGAS